MHQRMYFSVCVQYVVMGRNIVLLNVVIYNYLAFGKASHERFSQTFVATNVGLISSVSTVFCFSLNSKYKCITVKIWTGEYTLNIH